MDIRLLKTVIAASLALMGTTALAQTSASGSPTPTDGTQTTQAVTASPAQASTAADKIIAQFTTFSGSEENAASLVNGLRTGSEITLNSSTGGDSTGGASGTNTGTTNGGSASFTPPTKPMGYGNIRIALSLAKAQLSADGITQPTPEQLQTALMGDTSGATAGTTTQTQGILQMRASGMGWGQIANAMGFKLGAVMSGRAPANADPAAAQSSTGSVTETASGTSTGARGNGGSGRASGIVTATGGPAGGHGAKNPKGGTSGRSDGSSARSSGIFTATGGSLGGHGGRNSHAVSAAGNASGSTVVHGNGSGASSGAVGAQGQGRGLGNAYGHGK